MLAEIQCPECKGKGEIRSPATPAFKCACCAGKGRVARIEVQLNTIIEELRLLRKVFDDRRRKP